MEDAHLKALVEALIFVSEAPLSLDRIKEVVGEAGRKDLQRVLSALREEYARTPRGFSLEEVGEGFQFRTRPEHAEWVRRLKKGKPLAMSQPALETLAIVAYRQPLVRAEIEKIRGVDSGAVLRTLLDKKLLRILGKKDIPGRPLVYGTTKRFLEVFGLKDLTGLPTLKDLEGLGPPPAEILSPDFEEKLADEHETPAAVAEDPI